MNFSNLCRGSCLLFMIMIFILVQVPTSLCIDEKYVTCIAPLQCRNLRNARYPFWGSNRPEYCGYPGFELTCSSNFQEISDVYLPEITIRNRNYQVLNINKESKTLTVAREDDWKDICHVSSFALNNLFDYASNTQNMILYYNCPSAQDEILSTLLPNQFNCTPSYEIITNSSNVSSNERIIENYYFLWNSSRANDSTSMSSIRTYLESCAENITIPVSQSTARNLETNPNLITLSEALTFGFGLKWYANNSLCEECVRSDGVCGYDNGTREFACYCLKQPYPFTCPTSKGLFGLSLGINVILGVLACVGGIVVISVLFCMHRKKFLSCKTVAFWKKQTQNDQDVEAVIKNYGSLGPKRYSYANVRKITNLFKDKIGQGGYGSVYRGKLCNGRAVAVKVLNKSKENGEEFINEVACISSTSHVNIVALLGFCCERSERALIYEFMPNGSLDKFVYGKRSLNENQHLKWKTLNQIVVGVARGLEYLHRGCNNRIVHFDIKPHNILLDEDFCPKISDFGLAKLCKKKESIISMLDARGTAGYIAPEVFCRNFGGVSHKSDVYGFGMMVLEIVGVKNNIPGDVSRTNSTEIYFPDWIYKQLEPGEDLKLHGIVTEEEEEIVRKMILVSLWCIQTNPSDRPSMSKVVEMLDGGLEFLQVPPKPFFRSPSSRLFQRSFVTTPSLS